MEGIEAPFMDEVNTKVGKVIIYFDGKFWWDRRPIILPLEKNGYPDGKVYGGYPSQEKLIAAIEDMAGDDGVLD